MLNRFAPELWSHRPRVVLRYPITLRAPCTGAGSGASNRQRLLFQKRCSELSRCGHRQQQKPCSLVWPREHSPSQLLQTSPPARESCSHTLKLASPPVFTLPLRPVPIRNQSKLKGVPLWHQHAISVAKGPASETMFLTHR